MAATKTPHAAYDTYNLFQHVDNYLTRPQFSAPSRGEHYYPSEASVKVYDDTGTLVTEGGCLRASYYRIKKPARRENKSSRSAHILHMGKTIEEGLIEIFKQMGIWVANNVRFKDDEYNISGELDVVLVEPDGTIYGGEIKTAYGYNAESEIIGNARKPGFPKMSHLLQTLVYCWVFRDQLPYFRLIYIFRDSCARRTFKIELEEHDGLHYPKIDGVVYTKFTLEDVLQRFKELDYYVKNDIEPPRDFQLEYTDERVQELYQIGAISKTKYEKHFNKKKPVKIGDWQCRYCDFKNSCWGKTDSDNLEDEESDIPVEL